MRRVQTRQQLTDELGLADERGGKDWACWLGREDLSIEFTRLLASAQEGGSSIAECFSVASRIDISDDSSWGREWTRIGDTNRERGDAALKAGNVATARSNFLRATNYYLAAVFLPESPNGDSPRAVEGLRQSAQSFLRHRTPPGETVAIAWTGNRFLEGYFLPAWRADEAIFGVKTNPAPAVICIGEPGQRKEMYLYKAARHALDRGMSLLAIDFAGARAEEASEGAGGGPDLETAIGCIMDYVIERADVDKRRIAILADGWGSSLVARGIAHDDRFAAAVCDSGIWDLHERAFFQDRAPRFDFDVGLPHARGGLARSIKCPVLIATGERGWLKPGRVRELHAQMQAEAFDVTLKIFTSEETAAAQAHDDNPTLASEYIFDWIAGRFGAVSH